MSDQKRPLPVETVNGLRPPLPDYPYFGGADRFPFDPHATDCLLANASWLADASFLVYGDADFIEQGLTATALPEQGFRLSWLGDRDDNRGMILSNDDAIIVVFRGTRLQQHSVLDTAEVVMINQSDLWTDSQFFRKECEAGGKVHRGFLSAYSKVDDQLTNVIDAKSDGQSLWFTGHSLGGALAVIAATHFLAELHRVCTFGVPRVGNEEFAALLKDDLHDRYVHRDDWVPTVPPNFIGYRHNGTLHEVPGSPPRRFTEDFSSGAQGLFAAAKTMARELKFDLGELPMKVAGLADHAPAYYATLLWNALIACDSDDSESTSR